MKLSISDCHEAISSYKRERYIEDVHDGKITEGEFCGSACPHSPCYVCHYRGADECESCEPSCGVGGGRISCPLKNQPTFREVCYHAEQAYEKFLKALIRRLGKDPPKTHDLAFLLSQIPAVSTDELSFCVKSLDGRRYNEVRYYPERLEDEEISRCISCVKLLMDVIGSSDPCRD